MFQVWKLIKYILPILYQIWKLTINIKSMKTTPKVSTSNLSFQIWSFGREPQKTLSQFCYVLCFTWERFCCKVSYLSMFLGCIVLFLSSRVSISRAICTYLIYINKIKKMIKMIYCLWTNFFVSFNTESNKT